MLRILANLNVDRGRKIQRTPQTQPLEETDYYLANKVAWRPARKPSSRTTSSSGSSQDSIVNALSDIPPQFRDVVVLVDIGDFSYADAAQILDVPIGTVMSRLHRGRRALKQHLPRRRSHEGGPCERCEELLQDFLDRTLTDAEWQRGRDHSRLRLLPPPLPLEESLRRYVRTSSSSACRRG